jgi:hypothetical protein
MGRLVAERYDHDVALADTAGVEEPCHLVRTLVELTPAVPGLGAVVGGEDQGRRVAQPEAELGEPGAVGDPVGHRPDGTAISRQWRLGARVHEGCPVWATLVGPARRGPGVGPPGGVSDGR